MPAPASAPTRPSAPEAARSDHPRTGTKQNQPAKQVKQPKSGKPARDDVRSDVGLASSLRSSVLRLSRQIRWQRNEEIELTANQMSVLGALNKHGTMTVGELATYEKVKPPSVTRTINAMAERGLVRKDQHESDGRIVVLRLTKKAENLIEDNRRRRDLWLDAGLKELEPAERDLLRKAAPVLERLATA